jgi:hypothetical protein
LEDLRCSWWLPISPNARETYKKSIFGSSWQNSVGNGNYGAPYEDWNLLDRISFGWLLAQSFEKSSFLELELEESRAKLLETFVGDLQNSPQHLDFVALLRSTAFAKFIKNEASPSTIYFDSDDMNSH